MKIYSKIYGQGNSNRFIILHGLFGMGDNWATLARQWATHSDLEVHLPDMPNHGRSYKTNRFNYESMSADIIEYIESKMLVPTHILGHSMGGKTAMKIATLHPELISKLIVVDIAPRYYPVHHMPIIEALQSLNLSTENRADIEHQLSERISQSDIRMFLLKSLHRTSHGFEFRFNLEVIAEQIDEIGKALPASAVYYGPTLFIGGSRSDYILGSDYEPIKTHFPNARIETVENAGHWVHAEQPEKVYNLVAEFLSE